MGEAGITGLFTILGTLLGGIISYMISRDSKETKTLKTQVNILSKQVISYWNLEKLYAEELGKYSSKPARTILQEYREKIESMDLERPTMTEKEANKILNKNS